MGKLGSSGLTLCARKVDRTNAPRMNPTRGAPKFPSIVKARTIHRPYWLIDQKLFRDIFCLLVASTKNTQTSGLESKVVHHPKAPTVASPDWKRTHTEVR